MQPFVRGELPLPGRKVFVKQLIRKLGLPKKIATMRTSVLVEELPAVKCIYQHTVNGFGACHWQRYEK